MCDTGLVRRASRADAATRAWNIVVAAAAAIAVFASSASLLIGAGARSANVVQVQQNDNELCGWIGAKVSPVTAAFAESLGMAEPYGAIFEPPRISR